MGEHPLPPQAASSLVGRAGGNPLFLEALVREAGRADSLDQLPQSVEALVTSQMDRLDPADRTVVRYAAVFGTVVDEPTLDLLLAAHDAEVPAGALGRLADFLVRDPQGRLRSATRSAATWPTRGSRSADARRCTTTWGRAIEEASTTPESQCELLSLHFFHAGRHDRAWRYSVLAGERAVAKFAHGEAVEFFARAAQATPYHAVVGDLEVARVLEQLADSRFLLGPVRARRAGLRRRAPAPARRPGPAGRDHREGGPDRPPAAQVHPGDAPDQPRAERPGGRAGPPAAVARSLLARRYAYSRFNQGRIDEALHWAGVAAHEAEEAVDNDALAQAYEMLNAIYAGSGREEDLPYGRLALQAYRELGNLPRAGPLPQQPRRRGVHPRALERGAGPATEQATDIFRRIGDTASEGNAIYNHAELLVCQRRYDEAAALLPEVLRIARALDDEELVALALREQARTAGARGRPTPGRRRCWPTPTGGSSSWASRPRRGAPTSCWPRCCSTPAARRRPARCSTGSSSVRTSSRG